MKKHFLLIFLVSLFVVSCGNSKKASQQKRQTTNIPKKQKTLPKKVTKTKRPTPKAKTPVPKKTRRTASKKKKAVKNQKLTNTEYIGQYANAAMIEMRKFNIPASITLAQGLLESGSGNARLAKKANNHFGIKCHEWRGKRIYHDDDKKGECFRKYKRASESYRDHSIFLTTRSRYSKLFSLNPYDYKAWARGLKRAGYATDPKYPNKLIRLIEKFKLYEYDQKVLGANPKVRKKIKTSTLASYIVVKGDTLYGLARRYNTTVEALKKKNNLNSNTISIGQELLIPN